MRARPNAIVVSGDRETREGWLRRLEEAGFATLWCGGPDAVSGCPRLEGRSCILRESAAVGVVDVKGDAPFPPELLCTRLREDGRTVYVLRERRECSPVGALSLLEGPITEAELVEAVRARLRGTVPE